MLSESTIIAPAVEQGCRVPQPYYDADGITIYHGDCRVIVPQLGRFDLLLTDPPYGIRRAGQAATTCRNPKHNRKLHDDLGWDERPPARWVLEMLRSHADNAIIWGANYFPDCFEPRMGWLVWDKGQDFSTSDCELAFGSYDRALRKLVLNRGEIARDVSQHPTQKPEKLMRWCIEQAGDVQTILDPYAGSGTTGRAAKDLGKRAVLIEREEKYCQIAAERMSQGVLGLGNLDAYDDGSEGAEGGLDHTANPHKPGTDNHEAWAMGWKETDDHLNDVEAAMLGDDDDQ